jgi:hypothetical protein
MSPDEVTPILSHENPLRGHCVREHGIVVNPDPCAAHLLRRQHIVAELKQGLDNGISGILVGVEAGQYLCDLVLVDLGLNLVGVSGRVGPGID